MMDLLVAHVPVDIDKDNTFTQFCCLSGRKRAHGGKKVSKIRSRKKVSQNCLDSKCYVIFVTERHDTIDIYSVEEESVIESFQNKTENLSTVEREEDLRIPSYRFLYERCYITGLTLSGDHR